MSEAPSRGWILVPRVLPWWRMLIAIAGALTAAVFIYAGGERGEVLTWVELGLVSLAVPLSLVDRVNAHVVVRASLWGALMFGAAMALFGPAWMGIAVLL